MWCIKERHNPQLDKPYYSALGKKTKKERDRIEDCLYGCNYILTFRTKREYIEKCQELRIK